MKCVGIKHLYSLWISHKMMRRSFMVKDKQIFFYAWLQNVWPVLCWFKPILCSCMSLNGWHLPLHCNSVYRGGRLMALNKERNRCEVVSDLQVCAKSLFLIKRWQLCMSWTFITYRGVLTISIVCSALSSWWYVGAVVTSLLEGPGFEPVFLWGVCSHILHLNVS